MLVLRQTFQAHSGRIWHSQFRHRCFSSTKRVLDSQSSHNEPFRIAIVGAGASGMSTALHLAPLAEKGLIGKPIDVYEKSCPSDPHPHEIHPEAGDEDFHPGSGHVGREVGIGIWSTALEPFLRDASNRTHLELIRDLEEKGQYVGRVGYRTPSGKWLTRGKLNTDQLYVSPSRDGLDSIESNSDSTVNGTAAADPALLFIREKDFLSSLREACEIEEKQNGTIRIHRNTEVEDVALPRTVDEACSGYLKFSNTSNYYSASSTTTASNDTSSKPYNLIIAADGMHSKLRKKYAGYSRKWEQKTGVTDKLTEEWEKQVLEELNAIEDRQYTVFRGNAPLSDSEADMDGMSFQTWGEGKSMRFAAVGMSHPDTNNKNQRAEEQVWFATICDSETKGKKDAEHRKKLLLDSFKDWHDPVGSLIQSTPANQIFIERGVGHKHSVYPVFNLSEIIDFQEQCSRRKGHEAVKYEINSSLVGPGPILMFTGDAAMTVDPVLAQGFTIAMESAADFAQTLEICLNDTSSDSEIRSLRAQIQKAMSDRNQRRYERLLCLIRATELVQKISQPSDTLSGLLSNRLIRPAMMLVPSFLKEAVFSYMIKYSLGLYGSQSLYNKSSCDITQAAKVNTR